MLQVFFLILKIIGIILAAVLGLAILLLLLVLFVPVRYRAYGVKKEGECRAEAKISWLLHTLSRPILTGDGRLKLSHKGQGFLLTPSDRFISVDITDQFAVDVNDGVADNVSVSLPKQYHVNYGTSENRKHKIRVLIELM